MGIMHFSSITHFIQERKNQLKFVTLGTCCCSSEFNAKSSGVKFETQAAVISSYTEGKQHFGSGGIWKQEITHHN